MSLLNNLLIKTKSLFKILSSLSSSSLSGVLVLKRHLFAPLYNRRRLKASMSVEASVVLPVLIFAVVSVMIFFNIITVAWGISVGATDLVRTVALSGDSISLPSESGSFGISGAIRLALAEKEVPLNNVSGGSLGVSFLGSQISEEDVDIRVNYGVDVPIRFFGRKIFLITQRARARRWLGYDPSEDSIDGEYVYVTKNGVAFHRNIKCPYLNPSVSTAYHSAVEGRYSPCERCKNIGNEGICYITEYGNVYHNSVTCKSLIRYIERVLIENAGGRHACPKCG